MIYNMEALDFIEDIILKKRKSFVFFDRLITEKDPVYTPISTLMVITQIWQIQYCND